jgi:hypothetical protein
VRGVGPGTVLGGRYTVHERLDQARGTERWSADDTTLGRSVSVLVIENDDQRTPSFLDAARRAASVTHSVFVRILDVGTDDEVSFVVEEDLAEARTLAALSRDGGIPADEVRRITGEVAAALESARHRGMHHLDLTPDDVLRTPEGEIRLRGLEVASARVGEEATDADEAARKDAVGVVALTYAGLTGLWPLGSGGAGLDRAPRVLGGVAAPSEIASGVPRDLDALCRLTLNDDQGPTSPGDYARQVAPWSSRQVIGRPVTRLPAPRSAPPAQAPTTPPVEATAALPAAAPAPPSGAPPAEPPPAAPPGPPVVRPPVATPPVPPPAADPEVTDPEVTDPQGPDALRDDGAALGAPEGDHRSDTALPGEDDALQPFPSDREVPTALAGPGTRAGSRGSDPHGEPQRSGSALDDAVEAEQAPRRSGARRGLAALAGLAGAAGAAAGAAGASMRARTSGSGGSGGSGDGAAERTGGAGTDTRADAPSWVSGPAAAGATERRDPPPEWLSSPDEPRGSTLGPATRGTDDRADDRHDDHPEDRELVPTDDRATTRYADDHADDQDSGEGRPAAAVVVAGALGTVSQAVSGVARRAVDKVSELSPDTQRAEPTDGSHPDEPAPMVMTEPLSRDDSKLALAIVAAFLVLALVVGLYGISRIGKGSTNIFGPASGPVTRTTTVAPSTAASGDQSSDEGAAAPEPLAILGVTAYDPEGDGHEHDELVGKTFDGNPDTGWFTESYSDQDFGGLKDGVGLIVDLGPNEKPQQVVLDVPQKSSIDVYVGQDASLDGAEKIGENAEAEGEVTFDVPEKVTGQYIILWYTKVYPDSKGDIRGWLNEVTVLG